MKDRIKKIVSDVKRVNKIAAIILIVTFILLTSMLFVTKAVSAEEPGETTSGQTTWPEAVKIAIGFLSAAIATGMGSFAAGKAVSMVGSAAMGAVAEKPEILGRSLIFVGLAEGIAIYGLIISILILGRL